MNSAQWPILVIESGLMPGPFKQDKVSYPYLDITYPYCDTPDLTVSPQVCNDIINVLIIYIVRHLYCYLNKDQAAWFGLAWLPAVCEKHYFCMTALHLL